MVKTCVLLTKIAGLPGAYLRSAQEAGIKGMQAIKAKSGLSGLSMGPNVSTTLHNTPRVIQNRQGMYRGALLDKITTKLK